MTEQQIKEAISREFLRILANGHGFKVLEPPSDHGVDMIVCPVTVRNTPQGVRYLDSPFKLDFQLKATTLAGVVDEALQIKYDLEAKTYNDLISRRADALPLHLVLVVLNPTPPGCISIDESRLALSGCAYWYLPQAGAAETQNGATIRITIPKSNRLDMGFVRARFEQLGFDV